MNSSSSQQSKNELGRLIENCNQVIENTKTVTDPSRSQRKSLFLKNPNEQLYRDYRSLKKRNDEEEFRVTEKLKTLEQLAQIAYILKSELGMQSSEEISCQDAAKKEEDFQSAIKQLETLQKQNDKEFGSLSSLTEKWTCMRCNLVIEAGKNEKTCTFHPGKLKYYSCRQCGGDEYFTCCLKCRTCLPGCQTGLHKP